MCVLAKNGDDGHLATPARYYHLDVVVMFTTAAISPTMRNIAADRRVSIGVNTEHWLRRDGYAPRQSWSAA
jgi:hypothetical protein